MCKSTSFAQSPPPVSKGSPTATFKLYWGDTHDNTYQAPDPSFSMERHLKNASSHLDFYCGAYYPSTSPAFRRGGHPSQDATRQPLNVESWKPADQIATEWTAVCAAAHRMNSPHAFVVFPGYEWQGDGTWGDHNVFFNEEDPPLYRVETLRELYERLRGHAALAIPHHTAYVTGFRGKDWSVNDEEISPFMEIFSIHGSSEGERFGGSLRSNAFLGPDVGQNTYTAAARAGHRLGIIASTDNWGPMPGNYGTGLAAAWATELTRDALWDAFRSRRVYGVSGDRISLQFDLGDNPMGSIVPLPSRKPVFRVRVEALDRIDYIDFVRDETCIDRVSILSDGGPGLALSEEFLIRLEYGWGPAPNVLSLPPKDWSGTARVKGGEITGAIPCWISPGQRYTVDGGFSFEGITYQDTVSRPVQNGFVLRINGRKDAVVDIEIDGVQQRASLEEMERDGTVLWNRRESARLISERFGTDAEILTRKDVLFGMAYKSKVHPAVPSVVYSKDISFTDELFDGKPHAYRIRIRQQNGQMAWSSPIWLE